VVVGDLQNFALGPEREKRLDFMPPPPVLQGLSSGSMIM
jgi:hypothetical protein